MTNYEAASLVWKTQGFLPRLSNTQNRLQTSTNNNDFKRKYQKWVIRQTQGGIPDGQDMHEEKFQISSDQRNAPLNEESSYPHQEGRR